MFAEFVTEADVVNCEDAWIQNGQDCGCLGSTELPFVHDDTDSLIVPVAVNAYEVRYFYRSSVEVSTTH